MNLRTVPVANDIVIYLKIKRCYLTFNPKKMTVERKLSKNIRIAV